MQRGRLGTDSEGRILAIGHDVFSGNLPSEQTYEGAALQTRTLYAGPNRLTRHRLVPLDIPVASSMRAPGEAVGLMALECAMDELAEKLNLDPVELRVRNEPSEDPEKHIPYSSRHLIACLQEGARRFRWDKRYAKPGQVRDGRWLVGMGMAAATRGNPLLLSKANVRLDSDGIATVRMAMTDLVGAGMDADGEIQPGRNNKDFSQQSYGAHFAEVGVDIDTGEVRLRRMLGVFTAGRVLNVKTARSQAIGGMVFGVGSALHEAMTLDPRFGYFANHDLDEYYVP